MTRLKETLGLAYSGPGPESFDEAFAWAVEDCTRLIEDEAHARLEMGRKYDIELAKCEARLVYLKHLKEYAHEL